MSVGTACGILGNLNFFNLHSVFQKCLICILLNSWFFVDCGNKFLHVQLESIIPDDGFLDFIPVFTHGWKMWRDFAPDRIQTCLHTTYAYILPQLMHFVLTDVYKYFCMKELGNKYLKSVLILPRKAVKNLNLLCMSLCCLLFK